MTKLNSHTCDCIVIGGGAAGMGVTELPLKSGGDALQFDFHGLPDSFR